MNIMMMVIIIMVIKNYYQDDDNVYDDDNVNHDSILFMIFLLFKNFFQACFLSHPRLLNKNKRNICLLTSISNIK